jgi:large subunit ribosomal protein L18e
VKKLKATNPELIGLIQELKKKSREKQAEVWRYLAERLATSKRSRMAVNVSRLNRSTNEGDIVAVPGKVLGAGKANHSMTVAAFAFSDRAQSKILQAKGSCLSIRDLIKKNPEGANVKVIG